MWAAARSLDCVDHVGSCGLCSCAFTGISRNHLGLLVTELQPAWQAAREGRLHAGGDGLAVDGPGLVAGLGCSSATGWWSPWSTCGWLFRLADVFAYAAAEGVRLRIDGTEIRVRRPRAGRPGLIASGDVETDLRREVEVVSARSPETDVALIDPVVRASTTPNGAASATAPRPRPIRAMCRPIGRLRRSNRPMNCAGVRRPRSPRRGRPDFSRGVVSCCMR